MLLAMSLPGSTRQSNNVVPAKAKALEMPGAIPGMTAVCAMGGEHFNWFSFGSLSSRVGVWCMTAGSAVPVVVYACMMCLDNMVLGLGFPIHIEHIMHTPRWLLLLAAGLPLDLLALEGLRFQHEDWIVACDNTGTCRAAGFQKEEGGDTPVSVLLERKAGVNAPVQVQLMLGADPPAENEAFPSVVEMRAGRTVLQGIELSLHNGMGDLDSDQTGILLAAIRGTAPIRFHGEGKTWTLSSRGANAVLLKMDEFQRRVGTSSALIRPGRNVGSPLQPQPMPVIHAATVPQAPARTLTSEEPGYDSLYRRLEQAVRDECFHVFEGDEAKPDFQIHPLSDTRVLVSGTCWMAAYNTGDMYVLMDSDLSQVFAVVGTQFNDYGNGMLSYAHKNRGLGDCWSHAEYVWNGQQFVVSLEQSTGLCRGFAGGAWDLPTFVSEVRPAQPENTD